MGDHCRKKILIAGRRDLPLIAFIIILLSKCVKIIRELYVRSETQAVMACK